MEARVKAGYLRSRTVNEDTRYEKRSREKTSTGETFCACANTSLPHVTNLDLDACAAECNQCGRMRNNVRKSDSARKSRDKFHQWIFIHVCMCDIAVHLCQFRKKIFKYHAALVLGLRFTWRSQD